MYTHTYVTYVCTYIEEKVERESFIFISVFVRAHDFPSCEERSESEN